MIYKNKIKIIMKRKINNNNNNKWNKNGNEDKRSKIKIIKIFRKYKWWKKIYN